MIGLMLGTVVLGSWLGVAAQERGTPWPPAPIMPPEEIAGAVTPLPVSPPAAKVNKEIPPEDTVINASVAGRETPLKPLSPLVTASAEMLIEQGGVRKPTKRPAEIPALASKTTPDGLLPPPLTAPEPTVSAMPSAPPSEARAKPLQSPRPDPAPPAKAQKKTNAMPPRIVGQDAVPVRPNPALPRLTPASAAPVKADTTPPSVVAPPIGETAVASAPPEFVVEAVPEPLKHAPKRVEKSAPPAVPTALPKGPREIEVPPSAPAIVPPPTPDVKTEKPPAAPLDKPAPATAPPPAAPDIVPPAPMPETLREKPAPAPVDNPVPVKEPVAPLPEIVPPAPAPEPKVDKTPPPVARPSVAKEPVPPLPEIVPPAPAPMPETQPDKAAPAVPEKTPVAKEPLPPLPEIVAPAIPASEPAPKKETPATVEAPTPAKDTLPPLPTLVEPPTPAPPVVNPAPLPVSPPTPANVSPPLAPLPSVESPSPQLEPAPKAAPPVSVQRPIPVAPAPEAVAPKKADKPPAFLLVNPRRAQAPPPATTLTAPAVPSPGAPLGPDKLLAASGALIKIEKRGPAVLKQGMPASYQIVVHNAGSQPSGPVRIEDEIPPVARVQGGDPVPLQLGDKATWTLASLDPGAARTLQLELLAIASGEFVSQTTAFVSAASTSTRARVNDEPIALTPPATGLLAIKVNNPAKASVGQQVVFEVQVTNLSPQPLADLVLHVRLDEGLSHSAGKEIEADVGGLAAGATKTYRVPLAAARLGVHNVEVKIVAAGGAEAATRGTVTIIGGGLSIQVPSASKLWRDRDAELRIEVVNQSASAARNVVVSSALPEHVEFLSASDRGIYQASARTVQWLVDFVPPGQSRAVSLRVQAKKVGQLPLEVLVRGDELAEVRARSLVHVETFANLSVQITPRDQPLAVGRDTIYEVRVQNFGTAAATNVRVHVDMPAALAPGYAQGPTTPRTQGGQVAFEPIAKLPGRSQAVFHVGASALAAGDWRVRAVVSSDQYPQALTREAPTRTYRE
jgi:uncharacterized repeat protein (TIGR01451 family)